MDYYIIDGSSTELLAGVEEVNEYIMVAEAEDYPDIIAKFKEWLSQWDIEPTCINADLFTKSSADSYMVEYSLRPQYYSRKTHTATLEKTCLS